MALVITAFLALSAVCVLMLPARLVRRDVNGAELTPDQHASAVNSARTALLQGLVGLAALAGIFVAWQQLENDREQTRSDREQLRDQLRLTRQGQVAERFTRAVAQLGDDRIEVRVGGIYGLEQIASEAPAATEVLVAYLHRIAKKPRTTRWLREGNADLRVGKPDVHAALKVLGRRTNVDETGPRLDLGLLDLRRADLRDANLRHTDLRDTSLRGANLLDADLEDAWLNRADLRDVGLREVTLTRAVLSGADLTCAVLTGADLSGANLTGANLAGANLTDVTSDQDTKWPVGFDWQGAGVGAGRIDCK